MRSIGGSSIARVAIYTMSLVAFLQNTAVPRVADRGYVRKHKNRRVTIDEDLDEGERISSSLTTRYGAAAAADFIHNAGRANSGKQMPYGFYRQYIEEDLQMTFSNAKRQSLRSSLMEYAQRTAT